MKPRPNLFVVGAMKAGSTYLSRLLHAHPSIFICSPEEPSFFVDHEQLRHLWPEIWRRGYWRSEEHYLRLFADAGDATYIGEASTAYTKLPSVTGVPERIERFSPGSRYVYIMRDPVERSISHYWHMVVHEGDSRQMLDAIQNDRQFIAYSHYAMQLKAWFNVVGRDRVYTLTLEDLVDEPKRELHRLFEWLGLDPDYVPSVLGQPVNVTPPVVYQALGFHWLQRLRRSRLTSRIGRYLPESLKSAIAGLATVKVVRSEVPVGDTVEYLRSIQREQTRELSELLQRKFDKWTTLWDENRAVE